MRYTCRNDHRANGTSPVDMKQSPPGTSCLICRNFDLQPKCRQVRIGMRVREIEDSANVHLVHMSTPFGPRNVVHCSSSQADVVLATQPRSSGAPAAGALRWSAGRVGRRAERPSSSVSKHPRCSAGQRGGCASAEASMNNRSAPRRRARRGAGALVQTRGRGTDDKRSGLLSSPAKHPISHHCSFFITAVPARLLIPAHPSVIAVGGGWRSSRGRAAY